MSVCRVPILKKNGDVDNIKASFAGIGVLVCDVCLIELYCSMPTALQKKLFERQLTFFF